MSGTVTERSLQEFATQPTEIKLNDPLLLDGYNTVDKFIEECQRVSTEYQRAQRDDKEVAKELKDRVSELGYHQRYLLLVTSYAMVLKSFKQAIRGLFFCAVVAAIAIAIGAFGWATGQRTTAHLIFRSPPSAALVTLTDSGKKLLKDSLGRCCVEQRTIPVILLSIQDDKFEVVTTPSDKCRVTKFTVEAGTGTVKSTP